MTKVERLPWAILGREIGTATGWDQADTFIITLYDFLPADGIDLPSGDLSVNFETGLAETYDDAGELLLSKDIIAAVVVRSPQVLAHVDDGIK